MFTKKVDGVVEVLVFSNAPALTGRHVHDTTENTNGIGFKEVSEAYIKAYDGEPPLMPM